MSSISLADMTPEQVSNFCGVLNRNARAIEQHFDLRLRFGGQRIRVYLAAMALILSVFTKVAVSNEY